MSGALVISLDFELMWGVRDHRSVADYGDAVLGGREAVPRMLALFEKFGVKATWATVGFVFARTREEILDHAPQVRPTYERPGDSPYEFIAKGLGRSEDEDPLHFGHSLVRRIAQTEGQELATHSFSHFCCLEAGHSPEAYAADIAAAVAIGRSQGHAISSLVFARNQMAPAYIDAAFRAGISAYRGTPHGHIYRSVRQGDLGPVTRALRLLDSVVNLTGTATYTCPATTAKPVDVPASRFLRPWTAKADWMNRLHKRRISAEMEHAARSGSIYHLWWHPHNFGRNGDRNLAQLEALLVRFRELRDRYGMNSMTMQDFASAGNRS